MSPMQLVRASQNRVLTDITWLPMLSMMAQHHKRQEKETKRTIIQKTVMSRFYISCRQVKLLNAKLKKTNLDGRRV